MAEVSDDQLREMAQHRGLKLVKSRRRKPGTGDFGKYGLTNADGETLLGIGDDGLTASADDIQDYLRSSEQSTWKQSAEATPDRPAPRKKPRPPEHEEDERPIRRRTKSALRDGPAPRAREESAPARKSTSRARPKPPLRLVPKAVAELPADPEPTPKPAPEPELRIRAATANDADALSALLGLLGGVSLDSAEVADNLAVARKAKAGLVVAELGEIVGCCGWAVVPTVHRGLIGRLTVLMVDKRRRRRGLATAMLAAAEAALAKAGCRQIEAMSDITINNSHNFFRALKFEQISYRFVRMISERAIGERVGDRTN